MSQIMISVANSSDSIFYSDADFELLQRNLLKFATLQLRDVEKAQHLVQEAIDITAEYAHSFDNKEQLRAEIFHILRQKILKIVRLIPNESDGSLSNEQETKLNSQFDQNGAWIDGLNPTDWGQPEATFSNNQFWVMFELCLDNMSENISRVFMMREVLGLEMLEVCEELSISEHNFGTIMHKARSSLLLCLQESWNR
ncbi:MAG: hypothetical protein GQ470_04230 [Gammaproteobacteria bacterium]|nr:hypothetical protein [Gammaproteobacteria bacterium]